MEAPSTDPLPPNPRLGRFLAIAGSCCLFAPLIGLTITVSAMIHSFNTLASAGPDANQAALSNVVGQALLATAMGLMLGLLGIGLVCAAIFNFHFKPPWLRRTLVTASILWLPAFPLGTLIGVIALILLHLKRELFTPAPNTPPALPPLV